MHFVLFIPDSGDESLSISDTLISVGCGHLGDRVNTPQQITQGPDGGKGKLYSWMGNSGQVHRFEPDEWLPAIASPDEGFAECRYWVGVNSNSPPKPIDLLRSYPYSGENVLMGDGQQWLVPRATSLPFDAIRADDGSTVFIPQRKYHHFSLMADEWRNSLNIAKSGTTFLFDEMRDFVEQGLIANYRLLPEVSDYLKLFSTGPNGTVQPALLAAIAIITPETMAGG
jgi:hypothetical protein